MWKARRLEPVEELVALKILKPSLAQSASRMAQFRREAERGLRLAGPSLLTIYELKSRRLSFHGDAVCRRHVAARGHQVSVRPPLRR